MNPERTVSRNGERTWSIRDREEREHLHMQRPLVLRAAEGMAMVTSRRKFLRSVMRGAFALGASGALINSVFEDHAEAGTCGPSPYCLCCSDQSDPCGTCKNRKYATSSCGSPSCWISNPGNHLCCDCCCSAGCSPGGAQLCSSSSCGGTYYKCVCHVSCCGPAA